MSVSKLSDLLPIHPSVSKPNAYQVFGMNGGEQDAATVTAAMQRVYEGLKDSKATADPTVWKQAAKLAEAARKLLEDPERRCALDVTLGVSAVGSLHFGVPQPNAKSPETKSTVPAGAVPDENDPLAGLLPTSDPFSPAASEPASEPVATSNAASVLGTPTPGTPPIGAAVTTEDSAAMNWVPPKSETKRRKKSPGLFFFGMFVLVMLGAIIWLLQFLTAGGRIAISKTGLQDDDGVIVSEPMPTPDRLRPATPNRDGVLGNVPSTGIAASLREPEQESGLGDVAPFNNMIATDDSTASGTTNAQPPMSPETSMTPEPAPPDPTPTTEPTPTTGPTPEMAEANQAKVEAVEQLIRSANWKEMKPAADGLLKLELGADRSERASTLFDIADLAMFYRGAIERGLATLSAGSTFEVVDGLPVIVVAVSPESLSIRYNRKTQDYSIDELPPRLTEKIASLAIASERSDAIAGLALYRLIHPNTNAEYRRDAFELLASVDGKLETIDSAKLQQVVKELLSK